MSVKIPLFYLVSSNPLREYTLDHQRSNLDLSSFYSQPKRAEPIGMPIDQDGPIF